MPLNDHYVVIGNGPAGNHAAMILREKDPKAKVTIISDECVPYYYKPKLTGFISDKISREELMVKSWDSYKEKNIRIRLGQKVSRIDPETSRIYLQHMEQITYTKLVIASGSKARVLPDMEKFAENLKFITSYTHAMEYKDQIKNARDIFIFGGDFVGFQFLRMLSALGKNLTLLIYPRAFWPYNLTDDMLNKIVDNVSQYHVDIIEKDDIHRIEKQGAQYLVVTRKNLEKKVDMVFSFNGLIPSIDFLKGSGIDTDHGILVNEYLQTNIDNIFACGSCAQIYNPSIKSYSASIGWPNAISQGEVAAHNILGHGKAIESVGRKYFDLEGVKIKTTWWEDIDKDNDS